MAAIATVLVGTIVGEILDVERGGRSEYLVHRFEDIPGDRGGDGGGTVGVRYIGCRQIGVQRFEMSGI